MSGPRFSIIPAGAITDGRLQARDLQVLCVLGAHTDKNGWANRSQVTLARQLGCGRATVQRALARLVEAGWVEHRPHYRDSGADSAHYYRVILDQPDERAADLLDDDAPSGGPGEQDSGPTDPAQGVPTSGQGVPTHERAGGAHPCVGTNVNDPCLTTPAERNERERASAGEQESEKPEDGTPEFVDSDLFWRGKRRWPGRMGGNLPLEIRVWEAMSHYERAEAERSIEAVIDTAKKEGGRTKFVNWANYLKNHDWELIPKDQRDAPQAAFVRTWSGEWWALIHREIERGQTLDGFAPSLRRQVDGTAGLRWPRADLPDGEAVKALQPIHSATLEAWAWGRHLDERGLRLEVPGAGEGFWLRVPGRWPPGMDADTAAAAKRAADDAPRISPETAARMRELGLAAGDAQAADKDT